MKAIKILTEKKMLLISLHLCYVYEQQKWTYLIYGRYFFPVIL